MLLEPLIRNASTRPTAIAIVDDRGETSYGQLAAAAAALAQTIESSTKSDRVGILLPSSSAFAVCFYAALMAGKTPVPINFLLSPPQIGHIIADAGLDLILTAPPLAEKFAALPARLLDITALPRPTSMPALRPPPSARPDALAALLYTSATTGMPKGVELSHRNIAMCVQACIDHVFQDADHRFLGLVPLFHSLGLLGTLAAPMALGVPVTYQARFSPMGMIQSLRDRKPTIVIAIPSMLNAVASTKSASPEDFTSIYALISGGEPLSASLRQTYAEKFNVKIMEGYGLTETCGPISVNTPRHYRPGSVGRLLPGARAKVVDDAGNDVGPNREGEILLGGPMIMNGYRNLPDVTRSVIDAERLFRSGDLGRVDDEGFLYITGRAKDLIIVAGEKLHPREVEELLQQHPSIAEAAVVGRKDESRGEVVVAFVVAREGSTIDPNAIKEFLKQSGLPTWKLPREIHTIDQLPRSPTGKVLKRELANRT
jgi:long-chain acyl-CoA synthetase